MALNETERTEFVNTFARVLITAWSNDEFSAKLASDPRAALAESGLELPAGSQIVIDRSVPEARKEGNIDLQVELWERGLATGRFEFHIPEVPQIDTAELSEGDLAGVAGGVEPVDGDIKCCCCPCTTCT